MHNDIEEILFTEEEIQKRVRELGDIITKDYKGKDLLAICVLKGAVFFMTDLLKRIDLPAEIDFMAVSSYGSDTTSSGEVRILRDLEKSVNKRNILIVEDIIDTGFTLKKLKKNLEQRGAQSVKIVALLNKEARREVDLHADYCGFDIPDYFVVGYGLDFDERYRNLPYIGYLKKEVYEEEKVFE